VEYALILGLGMIAQALFSARFIIQLTKSELAGKVVSPALFWKLSLLASLLLIIYGFLRNDIVIIGGQIISYYIYIRNLQLKNEWKRIVFPLRYSFLFIPLFLLLFLIFFSLESLNGLLHNPEIPLYLLTYGSIGQLVFTLRFVVQWAHSEKKHESAFPASFWFISLAGAIIIIGYGIMRKDAVLVIGHLFGALVYSRNLFLHFFQKQVPKRESFSILAQIKHYRLIIFTAFVAIVLFANLNDWSVTESTEARYAQVSKEMFESGDYLHPTLMGIKHYHKPPLTYWITVAGYKLFGVNAFGARFFLQVAVILQILIVYGIAKLLLKSKKLAFLSAVIYFALPGVIMSSRALTTDVYLTTFVLLSVLSWLRFAIHGQKLYLLLFYFSLGLGFFTKGPVVFIFPFFILTGLYFAGIRPQKHLYYHLFGVFIMLIAGLSWFVYLYVIDNRFLDYFLIRHTVERFTTDVFKRTEPWWYFPVVVVASSFPWGVILFTRLVRFRNLRSIKGIIFFMWVVPPILFFSLSSSKLMLYVLPVYAGVAIGAIWAWTRLKQSQKNLWGNIQFIFHLIVLAGLTTVPFFESELSWSKHVYFLLIMTSSVLIVLRFTPIVSREKPIWAAAVFMYGLTLIMPYIFEYNPGKVKDTRRIVEYIDNQLPDTKNILIFDRRLPSIQFNSDYNIISLYAGEYTLAREVQFEKDHQWQNNLINLLEKPERINELIKPGNIMIIRSSKAIPEDFEEAFNAFKYRKNIDRYDIYHF